MENKDSLTELQKRFEKGLGQFFAENQENLARYFEQGQIGEFYLFLKYKLPDELTAWITNEVCYYEPLVRATINQLIVTEEEKQCCFSCEHHQEIREWVIGKVKNPPQIDLPQLKPNNVFYQGYGAFGMVATGIFVLMSYLPFYNPYFFPIKVAISLGFGSFYGIRTYRKYEMSYRQLLFEAGTKFLGENQKKIREWFDQIIVFSENNSEIGS